MGDYAVKLSVRNGRILRRMRECGIESQAELARCAGVTLPAVNSIICLRERAYNADGEWRQIAWNIATALQCEPDDLFNDQQRERALKQNGAEVFMDAWQVQSLMSGDGEESSWAKIEAQRLLAALPSERARNVIIARSEGATLAEIAQELNVTRETVRAIEAKAIRKMKAAAVRTDRDCKMKMLGAK